MVVKHTFIKLSNPEVVVIRLVVSYTLLVIASGEEASPIKQSRYQDWIYEPRTWQYTTDDLKVRETSIAPEIEDRDLLAIGISRDRYPEVIEREYLNESEVHRYKTDSNWIYSRFFNDECDQPKLDTRDAVLCTEDKCEKFKFDWPESNNQITIVQTTKHGMRFHRLNYAFNKDDQKNRNEPNSSLKFDIFDIFKPKTTRKPTKRPTTTTNRPATSTTEAQADVPTTTNQPPANEDDNKQKNKTDREKDLITTIKIDLNRKYQTIMGFGGALSDSTCLNIRGLSGKMSKSIVEDYFGDDGLRYNFVRMSIGSSDFSTTPYTNNDQAYSRENVTEDDDVDMRNFHLTKDDYEQKIPMARLVQSFARGRTVKFLASMWSPPVWMKNNSHIVHGFLKGDVYGPYYHALAELTIKFLEAFKKQGIDFWGLTVLNEPVTGIKPFIFHNSLGFTMDDYVTYIKIHLGPLLERRGFNSTKLLILDDNKGYAPKWVRAVFEDPDASRYVDGVAIHWYMNDEYENLNFIQEDYPDKFILSTEACTGHLPFQRHAQPGNWERGVSYMMDIVNVSPINHRESSVFLIMYLRQRTILLNLPIPLNR